MQWMTGTVIIQISMIWIISPVFYNILIAYPAIMPGQIILEKDRETIDPRFICTVCSLLLSLNPMQTPCGHFVCYECLQVLMSSPSPTCPSDGTKLKKENVYRDMFRKRELMALRLHCPNEGCDWLETYNDLQEHSTCCEHALIDCVHNQCNKEVKRGLLPKHLETECLYRQVTCSGCNEAMAFNLLEGHVNEECLETSLTCKHCNVAGLKRGEMEQHENVECKEILKDCEFKCIGCVEAAKSKEMRQHSRNGLLNHVRLLLKIILDLLAKVASLARKVEIVGTLQAAHEELKQRTRSFSNEIISNTEKLVTMVTRIVRMEKRIENLEEKSARHGNDPSMTSVVNISERQVVEMNNNHEKLNDKVRRLETEVRDKCSQIVRLQERLELIDVSLAETTVKLCDIEGPRSFNGTLLWRIDDFSRKRRDAVSVVQTAIYSPHFYTSQFGYKMCARVYLNGDGFGKETHISLFFVVTKGEYDSLLPWPFQKKITMMLLDQSNGDHMIDAFRSDPESSSFQRPTNNMNIASGSPLFMPLDGLNNRAYVKDDTIFIKIIVD